MPVVVPNKYMAPLIDIQTTEMPMSKPFKSLVWVCERKAPTGSIQKMASPREGGRSTLRRTPASHRQKEQKHVVVPV